jgi:hypothetical protein
MYDTLYILDGIKNILVWKIRVHNGGAASTITTSSGQFNGKLVENTNTILHGKNQGKANATTHYTQALKEADSKYADKVKSGYKSLKMLGLNADVTDTHVLLTKLDKAKTDANGLVKPMLCQPFKPNKIKYARYGQPKINGCRSLISRIQLDHGLFGIDDRLGFTSKDGLLFNIPHLEQDQQLQLLFEELVQLNSDNIIIDCELFIKGGKCTDVAGAARNVNNPYNKDIEIIILDLAIPNRIQKDRLTMLSTAFQARKEYKYKQQYCITSVISRVENKVIKSDDEARVYRDLCIDSGYEGCVLRDPFVEYKFGMRPVNIHKYKVRDSAEFRILDILPQESRPNLPQFLLQNNIDYQTFELIGSGTHIVQEEYLLHKELYIGCFATVEFYERTKTNLPFHCVFINVRNNE